MWVCFRDGNSGGYNKYAKKIIYIEAENLDEAKVIFMNLYQDPYHVTCSCCGPDFYFYDFESLEEATAYPRFSMEIETLEEYLKTEDFFIHYSKDIDSGMKRGDVPTSEEAWQDWDREEEHNHKVLMWVSFTNTNFNCSCGASSKLGKDAIYIEAENLNEAKVIFMNLYQDPYKITCFCYGTGIDFEEFDTLEEATKTQRFLEKIEDFQEYMKQENFFIHYLKDIDEIMKLGNVPNLQNAQEDYLRREGDYDNFWDWSENE